MTVVVLILIQEQSFMIYHNQMYHYASIKIWIYTIARAVLFFCGEHQLTD